MRLTRSRHGSCLRHSQSWRWNRRYWNIQARPDHEGQSCRREHQELQLTRDQSLIPIVMSGILAVYALVISVLIASDIKPPPDKNYSLFAGFMHMGAGLSVGLSGLAAGYAIGIVGDAVRACYVALQGQ